MDVPAYAIGTVLGIGIWLYPIIYYMVVDRGWCHFC